MEIRTGVDIIEVNRIKESIEQIGQVFVDRIFTEKEKEYCEKSNKMKYQHYAARFAAKEAVFKALSDTLDNKYGIEWKDIEIKNDDNGRPYVKLNDKFMETIESIDISISHCKEYAVASVVLIER